MRFNTQEMAGSRVRLRYTVELHYKLSGAAEFILNVHAAKTRRQTVVNESFVLAPENRILLDADPVTGNRIVSFSANAKSVVALYSATGFLFDPTGISPVTGLLRIGTGHDAADVSFATVFGPVQTSMPRIDILAIEAPVEGVALPMETDLAVSTAD
ncbi:MAG: hypothetical protein ABI569_03240 [Casimicrobiaceae bacterium]